MKKRWQRWSAAYAARARREQLLLGGAALAVVFAVVDALWLTPALSQRAQAEKLLRDKGAEVRQLAAQAAELEAQLHSQAAERRVALDNLRRELGTVSTALADFERTLVPARQMADFLRSLLPSGNGLEIIALRTLPPEPLVPRPELANVAADKAGGPETAAGRPGDKPAAGTAARRNAPAEAPNLYKHGVEIRLAGSYHALLHYLARLEQAPQKVLWGRLELRAEQYPRAELLLTLYTLSIDRSWLAV